MGAWLDKFEQLILNYSRRIITIFFIISAFVVTVSLVLSAVRYFDSPNISEKTILPYQSLKNLKIKHQQILIILITKKTKNLKNQKYKKIKLKKHIQCQNTSLKFLKLQNMYIHCMLLFTNGTHLL